MAGVLAAGAVWFGALGASAGSEEEKLRWPGRAVSSVAEAQRVSAAGRGDDSTLIVVVREVRDAFVDVGAEGFSPGDFFLFEDKLFNSTGTERIGRESVRCETGLLRTFTCEATLRINGRGKIRVAGTLFRRNDNVFPVTGGTGDFRGVGGTLQIYNLANEDLVFVFNLVKP